MKNYHLKAHVLLEMLAVFNVFIMIMLTLIPMMLRLEQHVHTQITSLENKRLMYTVLQKYPRTTLAKGVTLQSYHYQIEHKHYCMYKVTNNERIYCQKI